jgi:hypothetical protein
LKFNVTECVETVLRELRKSTINFQLSPKPPSSTRR